MLFEKIKRSNVIKAMILVSFQIYFQNIFQIIDSIIIGRHNEIAVSAIDIASQPLNIIRKMLSCIVLGYMILCPRMIEKNESFVSKSLGGVATLVMVLLSCIAIFILRYFSLDILTITMENNEVVNLAERYLNIVCFSVLFQNLSILFTAIMRCFNLEQISLKYNLITSVLNLCSDTIILIIAKRNILEYIALSTVVSQIIGVVGMLKIISKERLLCFSNNFNSIIYIIKIGIPASLDSLMYTIAQFILNNLICKYNPLVLTAYIYVIYFSNILTSIAEGVGNVVGVRVGKKCGEKKYKDARNILCTIGKKYAIINLFFF